MVAECALCVPVQFLAIEKRNSAFGTDTAVSPHADQIAQWDADDKLEERERIVDAVTPSK